jgi:hypothetical protein
MTTTTQKIEKINDIFNCKLLLEDGTEFTIPLREDGYIYATGLCKVAGKKMYDWLRLKETKLLTKNLEEKLAPVSKNLVEIYKGNNSNKNSQGTWIHPDLGLNLAQWCSPSFSAQISKWLRELIFTLNVELGKEKSNGEISEKYEEIIKKLEVTEEKLEQTESMNKELSKKYQAIHTNHQTYLRRKEKYKLKTGPCVYVIDMKKMYDDEEIKRFKIGQSGDITNRVSGFRTSNPFCKVIAVFYTDKSVELERSIKLRYDKQLFPNNSEFVSGVSKEDLMDDIIKLADILNFKYTIETNEELDKFNRHILCEKEIEEVLQVNAVITPDGIKRCGGLYHETEESRLQPVSNFFKNKGNDDGIARLCKECFLIGAYGENRKQKKVTTIPKHDITNQKWCNLCETVKEHKDFYTNKMTKDGLHANCKACKGEQKKKHKEEKKKNTPPPPEKKLSEEEQQKLKEIQSKNPLERFSKNELIELLKEKGIKFSKKKTKGEMIKVLE